jgi:hypothetical protein
MPRMRAAQSRRGKSPRVASVVARSCAQAMAVAVAGTQWQLYRWMRQWHLMLQLM